MAGRGITRRRGGSSRYDVSEVRGAVRQVSDHSSTTRATPLSGAQLAQLQRAARARSLVLLWLCVGTGAENRAMSAEGLDHLLTRFHLQ